MQWLEWEGFRFLTSQESTFSRCFGANIAGVLLYEQSLRVFFGGNWEYGTNIVPFDAFSCSVSLSPSPTNHVWIEQHLTIYKRKEKIKTRGFNFTMKMEVTFGGFCLQRTKLFPASLLSFALSFLYSVSCNVNTCFFAVKKKPKKHMTNYDRWEMWLKLRYGLIAATKRTWIPPWHKARAMEYATLVKFPRRTTWIVPFGMLFSTIATAKLLPSTNFTLSWGCLLKKRSPFLLSPSSWIICMYQISDIARFM